MSIRAAVGAMDDATAPPRSNGELLFDEPWHARAFGLAVALIQEQGLDWQEFRTRLIDEISRWEREHATAPSGTYSYYKRWAAALERLVLETSLVSTAELADEIRNVAANDVHEHTRTAEPRQSSADGHDVRSRT